MPDGDFHIDALLPPDMARRAEGLGARKAEMDATSTFALAVLAGAFIALGAVFATTIGAGAASIAIKDVTGAPVYTTGLAYGVSRLLAGVVFCLGLILVVVGGAELFTGNNLIVMAWASGKVTTVRLLRNWLIVYVGNFVGALGTAALVFLSKQYTFGGGAVGAAALATANAKVSLAFVPAFALGVLCNTLVCLAVWLSFSARSTVDRIVAVVFPITAFVAAGFEHSIANMYFIPIALLIKSDAAFLTSLGKSADDYAGLTWAAFFVKNLLPVTLGNIVGGAVLVGAVYWFIYLRPRLPKG
ncbi:MAG: formate/nitrite transporter family protein [Chloroflexi bacterium]|nr:formate/nitrite transporter family protein [Chloroflexota bacterium]